MLIGTGTPRHWHEDARVWHVVGARYLIVLALFNLLWEIAQLPLYSLYAEAPPSVIAYAVLHCTLGDILIGMLTLIAALIATRAGPLERWHWWRIGATAVGFGLAYTALSEWLNTTVLMSWTYSEWMPLTPILPLGISPILQWLVVPVAALVLARGTRCRKGRA